MYELWVLDCDNDWTFDCIISSFAVAIDMQQFYEYIVGEAVKIVYPDRGEV